MSFFSFYFTKLFECIKACIHDIEFCSCLSSCFSINIFNSSKAKNFLCFSFSTKLCTEREAQKILRFAGIKDVYGKARGQTRTKLNVMYACFDALKQLSKVKTKERHIQKLGIVGGRNE